MRLRELVEEKTKVPTEQQRLVVGTTVLEDWDEDGNIMHLYNYPAIHDGATVFLIQLTTGKRFATSKYSPMSFSRSLIPYVFRTMEIQEYCSYENVNIPNPKASSCTLKQLILCF